VGLNPGPVSNVSSYYHCEVVWGHGLILSADEQISIRISLLVGSGRFIGRRLARSLWRRSKLAWKLFQNFFLF